MPLKKRLHEILEVSPAGGPASKAFGFFILTLIVLNVLAIMIETIPEAGARFGASFRAFEVFSVAVFSAEYVLRIWTITESPAYARPVLGRLRYMVSAMALVDFFAVLPFYLPFIHADLRFIRAMRLFRIFRIAKIGRYSNSLRMLIDVMKKCKEELVITLSVLSFLIVISSSLMYYVENAAQPDKFSSIPAAMWWAVATLTTVGYGDIMPATAAGKVFGAVIAILGIAMFALPTGIIGAGFTGELDRRRHPRVCPHCGKVLEQ